MTNFPKFDLTNVIGSTWGKVVKDFPLLNGESNMADCLVTHYEGKRSAELATIAKEHPEYAEVVNGPEGLWLHDVWKDLRKAGHSEWVMNKVITTLSGE